jgi:hypothetical protein
MTGPEIDKSEDRKAVAEINQLWDEIKALLSAADAAAKKLVKGAA